MTYANITYFNILDVILLLILILATIHAIVASNVIDEFFRFVTFGGSLLIAACVHGSIANFLAKHVFQNLSVCFTATFAIILAYVLIFLLMRYISKGLLGLIGSKPSGKKEMAAAGFLRFLTVYIVLSVVIYVYHTKLKIAETSKRQYSHGVIYKALKNSGKSILGAGSRGGRSCYY